MSATATASVKQQRRRLWKAPPIATATLLLVSVLLAAAVDVASAAATAASSSSSNSGCPHPAVPSGASYFNVSGGLGAESWRIKYDCDIGNIYIILYIGRYRGSYRYSGTYRIQYSRYREHIGRFRGT